MRKSSLRERTGGLSWEDLRTVLAVVRGGSLSAAARSLEVEHSTVFRRIEEVERRLATRLFERDRGRYLATAAGEAIAESARVMENAALDAERRVQGADTRLSGVVRIATSEMLAVALLAPLFSEFLKAHPEIALEVSASNRSVDLDRREADIAVRATPEPPPHLIGRRVAELGYAAFARRGLVPVGRAIAPESVPWIGYEQSTGRFAIATWMQEALPQVRPRLRFDSLMVMLHAAAAGSGVAMLPCISAALEPKLVRISEVLAQPRMPVWVLSHPETRGNARVRALAQHLADRIPERLRMADLRCRAPDTTVVLPGPKIAVDLPPAAAVRRQRPATPPSRRSTTRRRSRA